MTTDELRELIARAEPLPWVACASSGARIIGVGPQPRSRVLAQFFDDDTGKDDQNLDLAVAAVNTLPLLLDRIQVLESAARKALPLVVGEEEADELEAALNMSPNTGNDNMSGGRVKDDDEQCMSGWEE